MSAKEGKWFGNKYYLPPVSRKLNLDHYWRLGDAFIEKSGALFPPPPSFSALSVDVQNDNCSGVVQSIP